MKWTTEQPNEPGWYWMRYGNEINIGCVFQAEENKLRVEFPHHNVFVSSLPYYEWAGPIPEPEE